MKPKTPCGRKRSFQSFALAVSKAGSKKILPKMLAPNNREDWRRLRGRYSVAGSVKKLEGRK